MAVLTRWEDGRVYWIEPWEADISVKPAPTYRESRCIPEGPRNAIEAST
ncbi:MAG: hypothetical protein LDL41_07705 [Coleofasciculus sp. S288]|nr:hypothetical protein [Coleofasciculus sp. S288]